MKTKAKHIKTRKGWANHLGTSGKEGEVLSSVAPELVDVPSRVDRFLVAVQRMMSSDDIGEIMACAAEVSRDAEKLAREQYQYRHMMAAMVARAPL